MTTQVLTLPIFRAFDAAGLPLAGGLLYTYAAGTTTPLATYSDAAGSTPNANPVVLDSTGTANVRLGESTYKFVLKDSSGATTLWTQDVVQGGGTFYSTNAAENAASVTPVNYGYAPGDVLRYGADPTGTVSSDAAFIAAEAVAYVGGGATIYAHAGTYLINGTITLRAGVTLLGDSKTAQYYPGDPYSAVGVTTIWKKSTGTAGPLFIMRTASAISGCYLRHEKANGANTGIICLGTANAGIPDSTFNVRVTDVHILGSATADVSGTNSCVGIYFMNGSVANTTQRYGNQFTNILIQSCDWGIKLGENCNANNFTGIIMQGVYYNYVLDGVGSGKGCVENTFSGLTNWNIGTLPTTPSIVFVLKNYALNNSFTGYATECNGSAFSIDSTCANNTFVGYENEVTSSWVPAGNFHSKYAQAVNRDQNSSMLIPALATPTNYLYGTGALVRQVVNVSGTMPALTSVTGTLVAADAASKVFARFNPTVYAKSSRICFRAKLTVSLQGPGGGVGNSIVEVEFWYRVTDNSTNAASLSVISVSQKQNTVFIAGLKFLTGVASGLGFGLAIVGGNFASTAQQIVADLELLAWTHDSNVVDMGKLSQITWGTGAATANDVTDAISLLTVADTAV